MIAQGAGILVKVENAMRVLSVAASWVLVVGSAMRPVGAARFTDTFSTSPGAMNRKPFIWDQFDAYHGAGSVWQTGKGFIEYRAEQQVGTYTGLGFADAGIDISDETTWSLEVGFRHLTGVVPRDYLYLTYARWYTADSGRMRIVGLSYDPGKKELVMYNSVRTETPLPVDLSGEFHSVRMTVANKQMKVYVDGKLLGGPYEILPRAYGDSETFLFGPLTQTEKHSLHCQWDYLAFTDEGAFAPGEGKWNPSADRKPVAQGLKLVAVKNVFAQPPYHGIRLVRKEKGRDRWEQAVPESMRWYSEVMKGTPDVLEAPFYHYPDEKGPNRQNVYQNSHVLKYDRTRCVATAMLTRGVDDTVAGFMDYKMWYRVSTDGGHLYGDLRPIVQQGEAYSPMHPIEYVYVGKNSFCYATIPGLIIKMSNGQIFFPCYYAPLDASGNYYNPLNAYTFSSVCGVIGTWNEAGDDLLWTVSQPVVIDADQSSRGADECAVIELAGKPGHLLMVIRGSNEPDQTGKIPACKWKTLSTDYGKTWSKCEPFTFDDGEMFLSPSSCCSFLRSSRTGKCYWVGNISRILPRGNWPRYPLVIAELDEKKLALRRKTLTLIDDRQPEDPPDLQLSNYDLIEDGRTGEIVLKVHRLVPGENPGSGPHTYVLRVR